MIWKICWTRIGDEAEGGLVEEQDPRSGHERASDRQHLLLAAREGAALLAGPLPETGEEPVDVLHLLEVLDLGTGEPAHQQVLVDRQAREDPATLRRLPDSLADDFVGRNVGDVGALELHPAGARVEQAADGLESGGLAGAVGADQGHDLAAVDLEGDPPEGVDRAVEGVDVGETQDRGGSLGRSRDCRRGAHAAGFPR